MHNSKYKAYTLLTCSILFAFSMLMSNPIRSESVKNDEINSSFDKWVAETKALKEDSVKPEKVTDQRDFIASFIEGVFSETPWNYQLAPDVQSLLFRFFLSRLNSSSRDALRDYNVFVWLADYATKVKGFPVFGALNKWEKQIIRVSVGLPTQPPNENIPAPQIDHAGIKKSYSIIADQIKKLAPEIYLTAGISLEMNSLSVQEDFSKDFGRLRFVDGGMIVEGKYNKQLNANEIKDISYLFHGDINTFEPIFYGGVSYTNGVDNQLEGYFLPNDKNLIQLAVCKIPPDLNETMLRAYITECVARSLGVPDIIPSVDDTIFGAWAKDGRYPQGLSPFDKKILSALYCDEVVSSMQRYEVSKVLISSSKCRGAK